VVIEEFMDGEELSLLGITDGREVVLLPAAQDHKRLLEGDEGPNTGGMGAYSPVSLATPALLDRSIERVFLPTLHQLKKEHAPFSGVLYAGLMVGPGGEARVIEFNCRFGDPETQVILPLLTGGLTECLYRVARGERPSTLSSRRSTYGVTTVLAARGYPDSPEKGAEIRIPRDLPDGVTVFHAGTARDSGGVLRSAGGRVLNVTAVAPTFAGAQALSRQGAGAVEYEGKVFRGDIGWREAKRLT
jgi:phosphoribosylamine--glycine ligase